MTTTDTGPQTSHTHDWYVLDADRDYCRDCQAIKDMRPQPGDEVMVRMSEAARWIMSLDLSPLPHHTRRYWKKAGTR